MTAVDLHTVAAHLPADAAMGALRQQKKSNLQSREVEGCHCSGSDQIKARRLETPSRKLCLWIGGQQHPQEEHVPSQGGKEEDLSTTCMVSRPPH